MRELPSSACYQKSNESNIQLMKRLHVDEKWVNGELTNFQYIMIANILSGRSLQDISQYPVFPWILNNYENMDFDIKYDCMLYIIN